jgi:hypothetical protein
MKLEYVEDAFYCEPVILLYGGTTAEVEELRVRLRHLSLAAITVLDIHSLPFVEPIDGVKLSLVGGTSDRGIRSIEPTAFEWTSRSSTWSEISGLLEAFVASSCSGFQFLNELAGPQMIYSVDRGW